MFVIISLLISCAPQAPELPAAVTVRVFSKYKISEVRIHAASLNADGRPASAVLLTLDGNNSAMNIVTDGRQHSSSEIKITSPLMKVTAETASGKKVRSYSGELTAKAGKGEIILINRIDLDIYAYNTAIAELLGCVSKNHATDWEQELLKAQEVAVRSYVASQVPRHKGYDLCDLTHCAVYYGIISNKNPLTPGEVLFKKGKIVTGYFHSTCGGNTRLPSSFWNDETDTGFRAKQDIYRGKYLCADSPNFRWRSEITASSLCSVFGLPGIKAMYTSLSVSNPATVNIDTGETLISIPVSDFISKTGKALGWNIVKSGNFTAGIQGEKIVLRGSGLGHGIGLCQHGALSLARLGKKYKEILSFYYDADVVKGR